MTDPTATPPPFPPFSPAVRQTRPIDDPPPENEEPLPERPDLRTLFEALLRRPSALGRHLEQSGGRAARSFLVVAVVSMLVYGVVLGSFAMGMQLWAAPLKLVAGMLLAGVICFPSLYIFCSLAGSRAQLPQLMGSLAGLLALAGVLLLGFAPAVWVFAQATNSYGFMGVLALAPWLVALIFGFRFLKASLFPEVEEVKGPLVVWCILFVLVTLQMTTSLRPILGRSEHFLTNEKRFFLEHWSASMDQSLGEEKRVKKSEP